MSLCIIVIGFASKACDINVEHKGLDLVLDAEKGLTRNVVSYAVIL